MLCRFKPDGSSNKKRGHINLSQGEIKGVAQRQKPLKQHEKFLILHQKAYTLSSNFPDQNGVIKIQKASLEISKAM